MLCYGRRHLCAIIQDIAFFNMWKIGFTKECLSSTLWYQQTDSLPIFKLNLKSKKDRGTQGSEWQWKTFQIHLPNTLVSGLCSGMTAQFCSHTSKPSNINELAVLKKNLRKKTRDFFSCFVDMPEEWALHCLHQGKIKATTRRPWIHSLLAWISEILYGCSCHSSWGMKLHWKCVCDEGSFRLY